MRKYQYYILCVSSVMVLNLPGRTQAIPSQKPMLYSWEKVADFDVDNLGNVYMLMQGQQLRKLNQQFDSVGVFNDIRQFGTVSMMDVSNPLRVLLYYQEFGTIIILDRFLNIRTSLDLRQAGILQCNVIAQSVDNNIWLFDELDNQIKKVDETGKLIVSSPDLRVLYDQPPHPTELVDFNRTLFAYDSTQGLLIMDYFGALRGPIAFTGWRNLHSMGKGLVGTDKTGLVYFVPGNAEPAKQPLWPELLNAKKIRLHGNRVFALFNNTLQVFENSP